MIYRRAIVAEAAINAAAALAVILGLAALFALGRALSSQADAYAGGGLLAALTLLNVLKYLPQILLLAAFVGLLLAAERYRRDHEFTAWAAAGLSPTKMAAAVLWLALPMAALQGWFALSGSPWAIRTAEAQLQAAALRRGPGDVAPGTFGVLASSDTAYLYESGEDGGIGRVFFARRKDGAHEVVLAARAGQTAEGAALDMESGRRYLVSDSAAGGTAVMGFDKLRAPLRRPPPEARSQALRAAPVSRLVSEWSDRAARAEMIWRLNLPLSLLALSLLAMPLARAHPRAARDYGLMLGVVTCFFQLNLLVFFKRAATDGDIPVFATLFLPHLIVFAVVLGLFRLFHRH